MRRAPAQGKLLEESIGREVKRFREKLGLTITELAKAAGHVGRHAVQDREWRDLAVALDRSRPCRGPCMCR